MTLVRINLTLALNSVLTCLQYFNHIRKSAFFRNLIAITSTMVKPLLREPNDNTFTWAQEKKSPNNFTGLSLSSRINGRKRCQASKKECGVTVWSSSRCQYIGWWPCLAEQQLQPWWCSHSSFIVVSPLNGTDKRNRKTSEKYKKFLKMPFQWFKAGVCN